MLWNLAGCSTFALGYGIHESYDEKSARAALKDVLKLALKEETLRRKLELAEKALSKIACSAPCKENHKSFNSPGQLCDQRVALEALAAVREGEGK